MRQHMPTTPLWRSIVEHADQGVLVLNSRGTVIFANETASQLLGYRPRDLLELDTNDILSLCYSNRLDFQQFARALTGATPASGNTYEVALVGRRLLMRPVSLSLDDAPVTIVYISAVRRWQSELVAEAILSEAMRGSLAMTSSAVDMLKKRIRDAIAEEQLAYPYEFESLTSIIHQGIEQALARWEQSNIFYEAAQANYLSHAKPVDVDLLFAAVLARDYESIQGSPRIELRFEDNLPPVFAVQSALLDAFQKLIEVVAFRLAADNRIVVSAEARRNFIWLQFWVVSEFEGPHLPDSYSLDALPLAFTEQVIVGHAGRMWSADDMLHITLPIAE